MKKLAVAAVIAFVFWNAYRMPDGAEYFHPVDGESQQYTVKVFAGNRLAAEGGLTIRSDDTVDIEGTEYQKTIFTSDGIPGRQKKTVYSRMSKEGIYSRSSIGARTPEHLELPLPPKVGRKWRYQVEDEWIEGEIAAIETLAMPGKTHHQCIKVLTKGVLDGRQAEAITYYAPKAGVVKMTLNFAGSTIEFALREQ